MDNAIKKWFDDEVSRLTSLANSGEPTEAAKATNKLNYLAYMESIFNGANAPELDIDAIGKNALDAVKADITAMFTDINNALTSLSQRIGSLEQTVNAEVNKG